MIYVISEQVNGIIIQKKGGAPVNGDTIKTSAGAVFKVPICKVDHIKDAIYLLQATEIKTVAATEKTEASIFDINFNQDGSYTVKTFQDQLSNLKEASQLFFDLRPVIETSLCKESKQLVNF